MDFCSFCSSPKEGKLVRGSGPFVCSLCWQLFMTVSRKDLEKVHRVCLAKGYNRKALAIENFLRLGNPEKTPKPLRNPPRPP